MRHETEQAETLAETIKTELEQMDPSQSVIESAAEDLVEIVEDLGRAYDEELERVRQLESEVEELENDTELEETREELEDLKESLHGFDPNDYRHVEAWETVARFVDRHDFKKVMEVLRSVD